MHHPASPNASGLTEPIVELLVGITRDLLGERGLVSVKVSQIDETCRFVVSVAPEAFNRLMGFDGRTAESLSVIVRAAGIKHGLIFDLVIDAEAHREQVVVVDALPVLHHDAAQYRRAFAALLIYDRTVAYD